MKKEVEITPPPIEEDVDIYSAAQRRLDLSPPFTEGIIFHVLFAAFMDAVAFYRRVFFPLLF